MSYTRIVKYDDDQQIVYGEVYAPNVVDSHGEMMTPEEVEKMCHRFLKECVLAETIDKNHTNKVEDAHPVESFIARGHPDYNEGAWVLGVKINDKELWAEVKKGEINGFSFEAYCRKTNAVIVVETIPTSIGETEENDGHTHFFVAKIDADGRVVRGRTSTSNGHSHEIKRGTATELTDGHRHRIFV